MATAVVLSAVALAAFLVGADARAFPSDLSGNFSLTNASDATLCPMNIVHTTFRNTSTSGVWLLPHNTILHDGARCNSEAEERSTVFYNSKLVPDGVPAELNKVLTTDGQNIEIKFPLDVRANTAGEEYYIGFEDVGRFCQDNSRFVNGTAYYLFRPFPPVNMPIAAFNSTEFKFIPDYKYLIAVPLYTGEVCIYEQLIEGTITFNRLNAIPTAIPPTSVPPTSMPPTSVAPMPSPNVEATPSDPKTPVPAEAEPSPSAVTTTVSTTATSSETVCFPGRATVELRDGSTKRMSEVAIGDIVRTSATSFSQVFMFTHKLSDVTHKFVNLRTSHSARTLQLTPGHYLYVNNRLSAAHTVKVGDTVSTINGPDTVISISTSTEIGLYNPQTVDGDIVVNGVLASTYTTTVAPSAAHALLAPLRAAFRSLRVHTAFAERGADKAAALLAPRGAAVH